MKKWLKHFALGFFSHREAREGLKQGYVATFLGFVLALLLIFSGFLGALTLPFGLNYKSAPDFTESLYALLASPKPERRIELEVDSGRLKMKRGGALLSDALLVSTIDSAADRETYQTAGYDLVVDSRPADTLAAFEAYCVSNDGENTEITYAEYLTLSEVARLNFDFKLRYTGEALTLTEEAIAGYLAYLADKGGDAAKAANERAEALARGEISSEEYGRAIYEAYFAAYYPDITAYESTSAVPLLRNYYYHEYIAKGEERYIFIFDDYLTASFVTEGGRTVSFYGFYTDLADGVILPAEASESEARELADGFIREAFGAVLPLNIYAGGVNTLSLLPYMALMLTVSALLAYSLMRLRGIEEATLGGMLKVVGSFSWFSGLISGLLTLALSFFADVGRLALLPSAFYFIALAARSIIFTLKEIKLSEGHSEQSAPTIGG